MVARARDDYLTEAAAYAHIKKSQAARTVTPIFYGTWTTMIAKPTGPYRDRKTITRTGRLISMEHVQGTCMRDMDPLNMRRRRRRRSRVFKKVLNAQAILVDAGIDHGDFCPRNVMVVGLVRGTTHVTIEAIDFEISTTVKEDWIEGLYKEKKDWPGKMLSPVVHRPRLVYHFFDWCSNE